MRAVVFVGPTLDAATVRAMLPGARVEGPVAFGDVYRAASQRPDVIAIIDGYFDRVAAVWHKEILWAMSQGIHVLGAGSMGALRAAELAALGMVGVGGVFEAFARGALEDDDEVAVTHADASAGFAPAAEAMVNIRATLRAAQAAGVLTPSSFEALQRLAKGRFYADRSYRQLLADASAAGMPPELLEGLQSFLLQGRVDAKRADALLLLELLQKWSLEPLAPKRVKYRFQPTDAWHEATRLAGAAPHEQVADSLDGLLEELKLSGQYTQTMAAAAARGMGLDTARNAGVRPDKDAIQGALAALRREHGVLQADDLPRWLEEQYLTDAQALRFFEDEARLAWARPLVDVLARRYVVDELRARGQYGELQARVVAKRVEAGVPFSVSAALRDLQLSESDLWHRYFVERLGRPVPADLDRYARRAGFGDLEELRAAVVKDETLRLRSPGPLS